MAHSIDGFPLNGWTVVEDPEDAVKTVFYDKLDPLAAKRALAKVHAAIREGRFKTIVNKAGEHYAGPDEACRVWALAH